MRFAIRLLLALVCLALVAGCATGETQITGVPRPPIDPDDVLLYHRLPPRYEEIGIISDRSFWPWAWVQPSRIAPISGELRAKAAAVGANGVLVRNLGASSVIEGVAIYVH